MQSSLVRSPRFRQFANVLGFIAVISTSVACSSSNSGNGAIFVAWTVNGTKDVSLCDKNVGWVVVQVTYSCTVWASSNAPCHAFNISFGNVPSADYDVSAYIFNADNTATLSSVSAHTITVTAAQTTTDTLAFSVPDA